LLPLPDVLLGTILEEALIVWDAVLTVYEAMTKRCQQLRSFHHMIDWTAGAIDKALEGMMTANSFDSLK